MLDLDAGKYAVFVWSAFGVTAAVFALMIIASLARARRWRSRARKLEAESDRDAP